MRRIVRSAGVEPSETVLEIGPGLCDTNKIERLFDNLLKNAVSYSFEGSVIHVTIISLNTDVIVKIKNHCPTIAPEMISGLFNEFFRLDNSRSSKTGSPNSKVRAVFSGAAVMVADCVPLLLAADLRINQVMNKFF